MKKVRVIHWIGLFGLVLLPAPSTRADVAADLRQAEGLYKAGKHAQAEQVCRKILESKPDDPHVIYQAGKMLPRIYLATNRLPETQEAVLQLLANSADQERLPHAVHEIVEQAKNLNKTSQVSQIYQDILTAQPEHPQAIWLKMGTIIANVYIGDTPAVEAGVQDIVARHSADPWAGEALAQIGWAYDKLNQYENARPLYEYAVTHWADKPRAIHTHTALVRGCIHLKDKQAAQAYLQQLISRYGGNPDLPNVLNQIARVYRESQMYGEARPVLQYMLVHYPDGDQRLWTERNLVLCDIELDNQEAAQTGVQKLITGHAKDGRLPGALNEIAGTYRESQMYDQAKSISQHILDHYPDSDQRIRAQRDLVLCDIGLGDQEATHAGIQNLVANYARNERLPSALTEIARVWRESRMYEESKPVSQFILDHFSDSDQCIWAHKNTMLCDIRLHNQDAVQTGFYEFTTRYAKDERLPGVLVQVSEECIQVRLCDQARLVSQYILDRYPNSRQCLSAQRDIVLSNLMLGDFETADSETQELVTRFAERPDVLWAVNQMAKTNSELGRHEQARNLFRFNLTNYPASDNTIWSLRGFINESVELNDEASIDAGSKKLLSEYAASKNLPTAALHVGRRLCIAGRPQAQELFQFLIDRYPNHEQALYARVCMGHIYIQQGQNSEAETLYREILSKYANSPHLAQAVNLMAEGYFDHALALEQADAKRLGSAEYAKIVQEQKRPAVVIDHYRRAIDKWGIIIEQLPLVPQHTANAWYFTGVVYRRHLDEPERALPYYQKVVETWPDYQYAWSAQAMIALCHETLVRLGKMTRQEAEPMIEQAHKAVVERYPDCSLAHHAYLALGELYLQNQQWDQAGACFQQFLARYPQAKEWPQILILLGITYERRGNLEIAAELYRSYLANAGPDDPRVEMVRAKLLYEEKEAEK